MTNITTSWFHLPKQKVAILCPPKCGTSALARCVYWANTGDPYAKGTDKVNWKLRSSGHCTRAAHVPEDYTLYQIVRTPIERFESLWRHQYRHIKPDALVRRIVQSPGGDMHWIRQVDYREGLRPLPVPIHHTERLLRSLGVTWVPTDPAHRNETDGEKPHYDNAAPLIRHYEADFLLWNEALQWTDDN